MLVLQNSKKQKTKLIAAGFDKNKITVLPNCMEVVEEPHYSCGNYVAFCGRLSEEKGVDIIIKAERRLPHIPFRLAGAIRDKRLLDDLPSNVELVGYKSGEDLNQFYQNSAFLVMASRTYEGFPISILEASKFGKPVVGPNHGGFTEIIGEGDEAIGRMFTPADVDGLEKQIVDLWNNKEECIRLGRRAFEKLEMQYSTEVLYLKWMSLMNRVINKRELDK